MLKYRAGLVAVLMLLAQVGLAQETPYQVATFRAIEAQDGVQVDVRIANEQTVAAEAVTGGLAQFRIREFLPWVVFDRDTRWLIFPKWRQDLFSVTVDTPVLNGVKARDAAQVTFRGDADRRLWAEALDDGIIRLEEISVVELTLVGTTGGTIIVSGTCDRLNIRANGAIIDASKLDCASTVMRVEQSEVTLAPGALLTSSHDGGDS